MSGLGTSTQAVSSVQVSPSLCQDIFVEWTDTMLSMRSPLTQRGISFFTLFPLNIWIIYTAWIHPDKPLSPVCFPSLSCFPALLAVSLMLSQDSFWSMKALDILWTTGEREFCVQTCDSEMTVSANGDQARRDEGIWNGEGSGSPPPPLPLCLQ